MTIQREPIFAALFALVSGAAGFVTTSRRLAHWNDVPLEAQPALYQAQGNQDASTSTGLPTVWDLYVDLYIYVRTDGDLPPGPLLNPLLDAIEAALAPAATNVQTLGGLVHFARIEGAIETDEGTLGPQAVAIVPIHIRVS